MNAAQDLEEIYSSRTVRRKLHELRKAGYIIGALSFAPALIAPKLTQAGMLELSRLRAKERAAELTGQTDASVPPGEVHFRQGRRTVGKIVNVGQRRA